MHADDPSRFAAIRNRQDSVTNRNLSSRFQVCTRLSAFLGRTPLLIPFFFIYIFCRSSSAGQARRTTLGFMLILISPTANRPSVSSIPPRSAPSRRRSVLKPYYTQQYNWPFSQTKLIQIRLAVKRAAVQASSRISITSPVTEVSRTAPPESLSSPLRMIAVSPESGHHTTNQD